LAHMSISTYFRPNIHQNGPENLGVNLQGALRLLCFKKKKRKKKKKKKCLSSTASVKYSFSPPL
jgi:hypothetical protein